jgi:hypothetical protein
MAPSGGAMNCFLGGVTGVLGKCILGQSENLYFLIILIK